MSDDTPELKTNSIQTTLDTKNETTPSITKKKQSNKLVWSVLFFQFLFIIALCSAGAYFYISFDRFKQDNNKALLEHTTSAEQSIQLLKADIAELSTMINQISSSTLSELKEEMNITLDRFSSFEQSVEKINLRLSELSPRDEQQWMIAQIEYFLKMAQYRINLTGDHHGAALLLDQAGIVAAQLRSPDAQALITAMSQDRANLKIDGHWQPELIHAQLNALIEKIPTLSINAYTRDDFNDISTPTSFSSEGFGKLISKLVRIQKTDTSVKPLLDETTRQQVEQHMFMLLTESQLHVMRQNQEGFISTLKQLSVLVTEAFNNQQKETKFFIEEIQRLQHVKITKPIITLNASEQALRNLIQIFEKKHG